MSRQVGEAFATLAQKDVDWLARSRSVLESPVKCTNECSQQLCASKCHVKPSSYHLVILSLSGRAVLTVGSTDNHN